MFSSRWSSASLRAECCSGPAPVLRRSTTWCWAAGRGSPTWGWTSRRSTARSRAWPKPRPYTWTYWADAPLRPCDVLRVHVCFIMWTSVCVFAHDGNWGEGEEEGEEEAEAARAHLCTETVTVNVTVNAPVLITRRKKPYGFWVIFELLFFSLFCFLGLFFFFCFSFKFADVVEACFTKWKPKCREDPVPLVLQNMWRSVCKRHKKRPIDSSPCLHSPHRITSLLYSISWKWTKGRAMCLFVMDSLWIHACR